MVSTSAREEYCGVIPLVGGNNGGGGTSGVGYLCLRPPEHIQTVHCDQAHYGPVSEDRAKNRATGIHADVETGRVECVGVADGGFGGVN